MLGKSLIYLIVGSILTSFPFVFDVFGQVGKELNIKNQVSSGTVGDEFLKIQATVDAMIPMFTTLMSVSGIIFLFLGVCGLKKYADGDYYSHYSNTDEDYNEKSNTDFSNNEKVDLEKSRNKYTSSMAEKIEDSQPELEEVIAGIFNNIDSERSITVNISADKNDSFESKNIKIKTEHEKYNDLLNDIKNKPLNIQNDYLKDFKRKVKNKELIATIDNKISMNNMS